MKTRLLALGIALAAMQAVPADAANCTIGGIARTCDINCSGACAVNPVNCNFGASDGWCVICGSAGADSIYGTSGDDWICAKGGADTIYTYPVGQSSLSDHGMDVVDAGGGDDEVYGAAGNDEFFGGSGDDVMDAGRGQNVLVGGNGDDTLYSYPANDVGAHVLCGGAGNDRLEVTGGGVGCLDCGADQSASGTDYDGTYINTVSGSEIGSVNNCVNENPSNDTTASPQLCGCE